MRVKTNLKAGVGDPTDNHSEAQVRAAGLKVQTGVKAGGIALNHSEAPARLGLKVRTGLKAGGLQLKNHSEARARAAGLKVRTGLKAGGLKLDNHSEAPARGGLKVHTGIKAGVPTRGKINVGS